MTTREGTIFDIYNAKQLAPREVAQTFVSSERFKTLAGRRNTIVVGPRGSGKTTLLKMLLQPALEAWKGPEAELYRRRIDFTAIFVATDREWEAQLQSLVKTMPDHGDFLAKATVSTQVFHSVILAMERRISGDSRRGDHRHRRVNVSLATQERLTRKLANLWMLHPEFGTLESLRDSLNVRLQDIHAIFQRELLLGAISRGERLAADKYLFLDFIHGTSAAIEAFDDVCIGERQTWVLLFDELELAPEWLRSKLLDNLRSKHEFLLFKLSISPYTGSLSLPDGSKLAMAGHDYDAIQLWYPEKREGYEFCEALLRNLVAAAGKGQVSALDMFGPSVFETSRNEYAKFGTAYREGSRLQSRFQEMANKDPSFAAYLALHGIDPATLEPRNATQRAAVIRKVTSLIAVRKEFRFFDELEPGRLRSQRYQFRRSRKRFSTLYAGASSLFAMVEGNPRWLIGIVNSLLDRPSLRGSIRPTDQMQAVEQACSRFQAMLKSVPCPPVSRSRDYDGILGLLDAIGDYFFNEVVMKDFSPEPPGSFIVDESANDELIDSLGKALNTGAIIYVPSADDEWPITNLRGKRFRLSYLLAPYYCIPLLLMSERNLSTILRGSLSKPTLSLFDDGADDE
jgi:hypothetical protein